MSKDNFMSDIVFDCPEIREIHRDTLVASIHHQFPGVDIEVIKKIVDLVTDKEVLVNSDNLVETLPLIVEFTLKKLFNVRQQF